MAQNRISSSAKRYAKALVELCNEQKSLDSLKSDVADLRSMIDQSADLQSLIYSPVISRDQAAGVVAALANKAKFSQYMTNTLALLASKGRLALVPDLLNALEESFIKAADEVQADITTANALTEKQTEALKKALEKMSGQSVNMVADVDEGIMGGMVVKMGSTLIDDSVSGKLDRLKRRLVG